VDARGDRILADQVAYYRARAKEYDETWHGGHDPELIAALDAAKPRGRVLELACGTGAWTQSLVRHPVASILAVDAAPEMLAIHAQRVPDPRITRLRADLFRWQPPDRFDFVTFAAWLSHVPPARFVSFWAMVASALADDGRVFLIDQDMRGMTLERPRRRSRLSDGDATTARRLGHEGRQGLSPAGGAGGIADGAWMARPMGPRPPRAFLGGGDSWLASAPDATQDVEL
jgi:SAM-dependent methyltransferase